ncbi:hypothetical protein CSB20_04315 [bacterium DOLZORAL124_64_63]|nr:MAG: hypothetical protein CSB20_04315 [bacterium DOLZORAL124_64_63]
MHQKNHLPPFSCLERYRNKGTRHSAYTEADDQYRPDGTTGRFELETLVAPGWRPQATMRQA